MAFLLLLFVSFQGVTRAACNYAELTDWQQGSRTIDQFESKIMVKRMRFAEVDGFLKKFSLQPPVQIEPNFWLAQTASQESSECKPVLINAFQIDSDRGFIVLSSFTESATLFQKIQEKVSKIDFSKGTLEEILSVRYDLGSVVVTIKNLQTTQTEKTLLPRIQELSTRDGYHPLNVDAEQPGSKSNHQFWYQRSDNASLRQVTIHTNEKNHSEVTIYESTTHSIK